MDARSLVKGICLYSLILYPGLLSVDGLTLPSCQAYYNIGHRESGTFTIDPDGPGNNSPFPVQCNFTSNEVQTIVNHDKQLTAPAPKAPSTYSFGIITLSYSGSSVQQVRSVVESSKSCRYDFRYDCHHVHITNNLYWVGFDGTEFKDWFVQDKGLCNGILRNCKCDSTDHAWHVEEGFISIPSGFPMTKMKFGDTDKIHENANYTLGPMICKGGMDDSTCKTKPCGSGVCLPGLNSYLCLCGKDDCTNHNTKTIGLTFEIRKNYRYSGHGKMTELPTCFIDDCLAFCFDHLTKCRGINFASGNICKCKLYDEQLYTNANHFTQDNDWSFYKFNF